MASAYDTAHSACHTAKENAQQPQWQGLWLAGWHRKLLIQMESLACKSAQVQQSLSRAHHDNDVVLLHATLPQDLVGLLQ